MNSIGQIACEPDEFNIDLIQGSSTEKSITITNNGNETITGHISVMNVECGIQCPGAKISIPESELIVLEPDESIIATITISSCILTDVQEITLPIQFYTNYSYDAETIADVNITVHRNYYVYAGIPIIIIVCIIGTIWYLKRKPRISE